MEVTQRRKELEMKVLLVSCPDFSPQVGSKELEKFDHLKTFFFKNSWHNIYEVLYINKTSIYCKAAF